MVDRSVSVLIACGECYLKDSEVIFMIITSLMKLAVKDMTTKHEQIKQFMLKVEASSDYFIHTTAEGTPRLMQSSSGMPNMRRHWRTRMRSRSTTPWPSSSNTPIIISPLQTRSTWFPRQTSVKTAMRHWIRSSSGSSWTKASAETNRTSISMQKRI